MAQPATARPRRRVFNVRACISYLAAFSFSIMLASGLVNFFAPSGRVARDVGWTLLALDRAGWQTLHLSFAIVFTVAGVVHLALNWQSLMHYLRDRASHHLTLKWELVLALLFTFG